MGVGIACVYTHFPAYVVASGTKTHLVAHCMSIMGIGNIIGRLLVGCLSNHWPAYIAHLFMTSAFVTAALSLLAPVVCRTFATQAVFSFLQALSANGFIPLMAPMCIEIVGLARLNLAYGIAIIVCGCGYLAGPPIAGNTLHYKHKVICMT